MSGYSGVRIRRNGAGYSGVRTRTGTGYFGTLFYLQQSPSGPWEDEPQDMEPVGPEALCDPPCDPSTSEVTVYESTRCLAPNGIGGFVRGRQRVKKVYQVTTWSLRVPCFGECPADTKTLVSETEEGDCEAYMIAHAGF